jgi:hypothetical protein
METRWHEGQADMRAAQAAGLTSEMKDVLDENQYQTILKEIPPIL